MNTFKPRKTTLAGAIRIAAFAGAIALAGCASLPPHPEIVALQNRYELTLSQPFASQEAQSELDDTRAALNQARVAYADHDEDELAHYLVVADKNLDIADARVHLYETNRQIASATEVREGMLRVARERDIAVAQAETRSAEANARSAEANARLAQNEAARRSIELAAQQDQLRDREAELRAQERQLDLTEDQLAAAEARADALERQAQLLADRLTEVTMVTNERGTVLVLSDVLFDFDSAALKPGSQQALDEVADFLIAQEGAQLKIEGHTDSLGSHGYNMGLSGDRANAVRDALVARGVPARRIQLDGYGEDYPVASNGSESGRQLNRRVEIILDDRIGGPISSNID